jgi:kumamolisin
MKVAACVVCVLLGLVAGTPSGAAAERPGRPAAPAASPLDVVLNLSGRREQALAAYVRAVSDPTSPVYRRYLTLRRIADRFGAPTRDSRRVLAFLRDLGLRGRVDRSRTFVSVRMPVELAEALFSTRLVRIPSTTRRVTLRPVGEPSVPPGLADVVDGVGGLDTRTVVSTDAAAAPVATFGPGASGMQRSGTPAGCTDGQQSSSPLGVPGFTPNQWLDAYAVRQLHSRGLTGDGQRLALIEIDGYLESDLAAAATCFGYTAPPLRRVLVGLEQPLDPGGETTLDLQVISATAPGLDEIQIYQGDASLAALLLTFAAPLEEPAERRPHVISASLGACEPDYTDQVSLVEAGEQLFRVYAALGITVVASAGDTGSSGCALAGNSSALGVLAVSYPGSSAYVTAVGGTNLELDGANGIVEEPVWNDNPITVDSSTVFGGAGGGGQSLILGRPWWQTTRTATGPNRLVPDVALLADIAPGYAIYCTVASESLCQPGGFVSIGGTSAAAPLFAASVALANQAAARRGQARLGFVSPLLYRIGASANDVFHDVTDGSNDVGAFLPVEARGGEPLGCCEAGIGWDRASGWGSVNAAAFESAARAAFSSRPRR